MRIGFDLRPFLKHETGVGVYFRNLLFELARIDPDDEMFLFSSSWKDRFVPDRVPPFARRRFLDRRIPVRVLDFLWSRFEWPTLDALFGVRLDLTHSPGPLVLPSRGKKVVTVNDLFFLDRPELADRQSRRDFTRRAGRSIAKADGIIVISRDTGRRLLERFRLDESRLRVIPLGLAAEWFEAPAAADTDRLRRELGLPRDFLLFVGALEPRKNLVRLVEAVKLLADGGLRLPLIIVGRPGGDSDRVAEAVRRLGLGELVRLVGYLDEKDVRGLHHLASALVFPSLFEGFGLPVLEAMASGLPVAASGTSALPEVAGEGALFFDPEKPEDIAATVRRLLEDSALRKSLVEKGKRRAREFTWRETASRTLEFYHAL